MENEEFQKLIGKMSLTVAECMQAIDLNSSGILFIADDNRKLLGCITDKSEAKRS